MLHIYLLLSERSLPAAILRRTFPLNWPCAVAPRPCGLGGRVRRTPPLLTGWLDGAASAVSGAVHCLRRPVFREVTLPGPRC